MSIFGERLRELRKQAGFSQSELAVKLKISKSSVNMYERGEREPGFEIMEAIADLFNVDMDYLYGRSDCKNEVKRKYDEMFMSPAVTREAMAYAIHHAVEGIPEDFSQIPEQQEGMVKKAVDFMHIFMELPDDKQKELLGYMKYISEKEKAK